MGSLSRLVWSGLRVGWIRAPRPLIQRLALVKAALDLGSPLQTQAIATRLIGAMSEARRLRTRELKPRRDFLIRLLREYLPEWEFRVPAGSLFLWIQLPGVDARIFSQVAYRHGVVTLPGATMSFTGDATDCLRLPYFWDEDTLQTGAARLSAAWQVFRASDLRAI